MAALSSEARAGILARAQAVGWKSRARVERTVRPALGDPKHQRETTPVPE